MLRFTSRRLTDDSKIPGFALLFQTSPESKKLSGYFPNIAYGIGNDQEWIAYFNKEREERFESLTKITQKNAFYRFLKHDLEGDEYYYCLPRGFTKSELNTLEMDQNTLKSLKGKTYRFEPLTKLTLGIGTCNLVQI